MILTVQNVYNANGSISCYAARRMDGFLLGLIQAKTVFYVMHLKYREGLLRRI